MPLFITIRYSDHRGLRPAGRTRPVHDAPTRARRRASGKGAVMSVAGLPVQVRQRGAAGVETADGPYSPPACQFAGFALIEAPRPRGRRRDRHPPRRAPSPTASVRSSRSRPAGRVQQRARSRARRW